MSKDTIVIGFWAASSTAAKGAGRWDKMAALRVAGAARRPAGQTHRVAARTSASGAGPAGQPRHRRHLARHRSRVGEPQRGQPWDFGDVCRPLRLGAPLPLRHRARAVLDAHHHRHPCGADLHVPDGGIPVHPRRAAADCPAPKQRGGDPGSYTLIDLDLSRYDAIAQRHAQVVQDDLSFLKKRHRHPQPALQRTHPKRSSAWPSARKPRAAHRTHRRKQSRTWPPHLPAQEGQASGQGRVRRGELRHLAR